jgi:hypothetical protein
MAVLPLLGYPWPPTPPVRLQAMMFPGFDYLLGSSIRMLNLGYKILGELSGSMYCTSCCMYVQMIKCRQ